MRNRIRLLALAVVAIGGGTLASPQAAHATYAPPLGGPAIYCCCEVNSVNMCSNKCCSPRGCTITANGCLTARM
jgi:hypothetical protein